MKPYPAVFWGRAGVILASLIVLAFLMAPIILVITYAFSASNVQTFPIQGWSLHWLHQAMADDQVRESAGISVQVACLGTLGATLLGWPGGLRHPTVSSSSVATAPSFS